MTLNEIENYVIGNNKFRVSYRGDIGYSTGVLVAIENNEGFCNEVEGALKRFESRDFGTMYDVGETIVEGCEYGCYDTSIGELFIHREFAMIVIYFCFER